MDGILLENGTFIEKDTAYHIDLVRNIFPDCKTELDAIKRHQCIFLIESRDIHTGIRCMKDDFMILGENGLKTEQILFLKEHLDDLSLSQMKQVPELAQIKGLSFHEKCSDCIHCCTRADFINGNHTFSNQEDKVEYLKGNLKPDEYCECCRKCSKGEHL